jgi:hypothetical protein
MGLLILFGIAGLFGIGGIIYSYMDKEKPRLSKS